MSKSFGQDFLKTASLLCLAATFSISAAHAYDGAILSGIKIDSIGDSYEITLKSNQQIPVKKYITSDNKIVLDLKDIKSAKSVNTIYNNASQVDHVVIQPVGAHLKLFLQGENIADSEIKIDTSKSPFTIADNNLTDILKNSSEARNSNPQNVITLDKPIESYMPIINENDDKELLSDNPAGISLSEIFQTKFPKIDLGWLACFAVLGFVFINKFKDLLPNKKIKVDLFQGLKDNELDIYKKLNKERTLLTNNTDMNKDYSKITGYNSFSKYGLKEYQNNDIYPSKRKPVGLGYTNSPIDSKFKKPSLAGTATMQRTTTRPVVSKPQLSSVQRDMARTSNVDGVKFLESMAKIYEKSGRVDLAHGLQDNILKAKKRA
ncbi:MAG: hypothetical protein PHV68_03425 [Candidatus Gastranaerophilales bacterium]|nr:hypothetical protein [Candidatus Gastranaerophilales bacterium]